MCSALRACTSGWKGWALRAHLAGTYSQRYDIGRGRVVVYARVAVCKGGNGGVGSRVTEAYAWRFERGDLGMKN